MHRIIWDFLPAPGREAEFQASYSPRGPWAELFRRAPGYLGTELGETPGRPGWYRTVDTWVSAEARANFLAGFGEEYQALDRACALLTAEEHKVSEGPF